jgi:hypothetical protein
LGVVAGAVAGRGGEVAVQDRPAGGVLVDEEAAGGVGVAVEIAVSGRLAALSTRLSIRCATSE